MPELPEVEAARRGIAEQFLDDEVVAVDLRLPKLIVAPDGLGIEQVVGTAFSAVRRHGKYLTMLAGDLALVIHLKLSGQLVGRGLTIPGFDAGHPVPAYGAELPHKSTHLIIDFASGSRLYLTDIRHFARVQVMPADSLDAYFAGLRLGPDAISDAFERDWFHEAIARRSQARLKPLLLDQTFIAGLGNIYVDEALHRAMLHPERLARTLTPGEIDRLYDAINEIMAIAVPIGGAHILNGKAGPDQGEFPFVHGREGLACVNCGATIVK
ncbi:MAG TPA: DNA-formamidopyrimidine glycosylase family protein, partial [Thermomicrobiales bacterium]|nr:DNA-formamidopyrimidine glycosylase family protein [Thermomicrobiales bacterium]